MKINRLLFPCLFILSSILLFSCQKKSRTDRTVSVSILPQKYFIERIAGDYVRVNVMIPPGMNPATCDLLTEQLKKLYDSDLYFAIGYLPFETSHLYPVLENHKNIRLVKHSDRLDLIQGSCGHAHGHHHEGGIDPHIWLSPRYAREMAREMTDVLAQKYPEQKELFETNYRKLEKEIQALEEEAGQLLAQKQHKIFLIYHPALTYFARDYGMEQISIEDEGKEPHPEHLKDIIDLAQTKDIQLIFIQNQFDVTNAEAIAKETGGKIVPIDPLNENWQAEMQHLLQILEQNLN